MRGKKEKNDETHRLTVCTISSSYALVSKLNEFVLDRLGLRTFDFFFFYISVPAGRPEFIVFG